MPFTFIPKNSDHTTVSVSTSSTQLLAARVERLGFSVWNDGTVNMYVKLGTSASSSSFTAMLVPGALYECPFFYAGAVTAVTASSTGNARIEEAY